jgi:hypothetical protein
MAGPPAMAGIGSDVTDRPHGGLREAPGERVDHVGERQAD